MDGKKRDRSYIQCLNCGNVYAMGHKIPMSESIVKSVCPSCNYSRGLHCGYDETDVAELKDFYLDERYFIY